MEFKKRYILYGILGIMALTVVGSFLGVFSSVVSAPGRVISKTLKTDNIIHNYELFYDRNAAYEKRLLDIQGHKSLLAVTDDKAEVTRLNIELVGMQQTCRNIATKYNADTEKMNRSLFKANELPYTLSMKECG